MGSIGVLRVAFKEIEQRAVDPSDVVIALDPHRPGVERGRLVKEGIPIWGLIGSMGGENGVVDAEAVVRTAADYQISEAAAWAAVAYYRAFHCAIDTLLDSNGWATHNDPESLPRFVWNERDGLRRVV